MTEDEYLTFLEWNAQQVIPGKSGAMDSSLPPILERIGVAPAFWLKMIENWYVPLNKKSLAKGHLELS